MTKKQGCYRGTPLFLVLKIESVIRKIGQKKENIKIL